jgi:hypothetical protein
MHASVALPNGDVLVCGGHGGYIPTHGENASELPNLKAAWIYSVSKNTWRRAANMNTYRARHQLLTFNNGQTIVAVGGPVEGLAAVHGNPRAEIYDYEKDEWRFAPEYDLPLIPQSGDSAYHQRYTFYASGD